MIIRNDYELNSRILSTVLFSSIECEKCSHEDTSGLNIESIESFVHILGDRGWKYDSDKDIILCPDCAEKEKKKGV